jgi:LuxR family transcriptional regulator, maltose regulon positive regulatory protein
MKKPALTLKADLDLSETSGFLAQATLAVDDRTERLVLDLAEVRFVDCAGVRALDVAASFAPGGCPVIIRSLSPRARRIFELLDLDLDTLRPAFPAPHAIQPTWGQPPARNVATREPSNGPQLQRVTQMGDDTFLVQVVRPVLDLVASKLLRPLTRPGTIDRARLIEQMAHGGPRPVISVVAPAGYGKTTLLSQWAERGWQAFAWVSVDEGDNDPRVLLSYIAEALDAVEPISGRVFEALASTASSVPGLVIPRLASAFRSMSSPMVLVLDNVHVLRNFECRAAVSVLADHVPDGSRLVLAGRADPPLRVARLRAEGRILEIGPGDLSLSSAEASSLLRSADVVLGAGEVAELYRRTEGCPVGLYLAALYLREGGSAGSFSGSDRFVSEYMESEVLERISGQQRVFLTRTAVLERMCGPLCDAVLGLDGGVAALAELARSNLLLVPLDHQEQWYRYHHLFRDMLLAELDRAEPGLIPLLGRRAADWCLDNGLAKEALEYSIAAGDVDTAARLVEEHWLQALFQGRDATLRRWIQWLDDRGGVEQHPMVAAAALLSSTVFGRPADADRWARWVERWQSQDGAQPDDPAIKAWAALLRAYLCRNGIEQMRADADEAARLFAAAQGFMIPLSALLQGIARVLSGDLDGGDAYFKGSVAAGEIVSGPHHAVALAERSLLAMARGEWGEAEVLAGQAGTVLRQAGIDESIATPLVCAVQARAALHRGDNEAARQQARSAQRVRPWLSYAVPYLAMQARIELTRVDLVLADLVGARTLMRETDEMLKQRPGLGTLVGEAEALRAQLAKQRGSVAPGPSALTAAELRLLPLMSTQLQMHEIAAEMYLSPHTVRAQSKSIYRKLGATTRSQAVARARELGLLEG